MSDDVIDSVEWMETLPEAIQNAPYFKAKDDGTTRSVEQIVADLENAAKLQGNMGETHIRIPSPDAADEDWGKFRERVTTVDPTVITKPDDYSPVPDSVDGYTVPELDGFDDSGIDTLKALAFEAKWNQAQFEHFLNNAVKEQGAAKEARIDYVNAQNKILDEKLGQAKGDHLLRTAAALEGQLPDETLVALRNGELDAGLTLALDSLVHKIVEMGSEDSQFNRQANSGPRPLTPEEAKAKADELFVTLQGMTPGSADYNRLLEKRMEYLRLAKTAA